MATAGAMHLDDDHKRWGIAIFVLYFVQCALGAIIHWIKPASFTVRKKRPVQNYFHAILGLLVIGLAFYQVRLRSPQFPNALSISSHPSARQVRDGFKNEWAVSGRPPISKAADIVWYIWVAVSSQLSSIRTRKLMFSLFKLVPVLYLAGLALLPKQFRQERPRHKQAPSDEYAMRSSYTDEPRYSDRG